MKILVVNDYEPSRYASVRILRENGFEVTEAGTGGSALEMVRRDGPDLVLLDVNLPDIDGFEVCRRIKADPETSSTAVLQISAAYIARSDRVRGLEIGADAYLVEPVEPTELVATVRALLRMRAAERSLRSAAEEWRETFNAISAPIALVDRSGGVVRANRAFMDAFCEGEERNGAICDTIFRSGDDPGVSVLSGLIADLPERSVDLRVRDRWFKVTVSPVRDDGVQTAVCIFEDVTDERRLSSERAAVLALEKEARSAAEASRKRADFLSKASAAMTVSLSVEDIVANVARVSTNAMADWCFIDLRDEAGGALEVAAVSARSGVDTANARAGHEHMLNHLTAAHPIQRVIDGAHTEVYPDSLATRSRATGDLPDDLARIEAISFISVPLCARGRVVGVVTVTREKGSNAFDLDEVATFEELAQRIALALDNARLYNAAQAANRAKDEFLATLSHELRTPLTATLGWAKMVRMGGLDQPTYDAALEAIERSTEVQSQIIEDILDVSRIVTGKLTVEMQRTDLGSVTLAAVTSLRPAADAKNIEVSTRIEPELPHLWGDARRLQQIVWNLLSNAVKFTPEGGRVDVDVESLGTHVRITVRDTGKGIDPKFLPHVFDRFRQADGASTREHGGLGLGLAIVRHLVEMHGGVIRAESAGPEQGACFIVEFPVARVLPPESEDVAIPRDLPKLDGAKVLVVEDQGDTRDWIVAVLTQSGAEVRSAPSVQLAVDELRGWMPSLIISDISMPVEDGFDLLRHVRSDGARDGVPVVALSAYARTADRDRALDAGFTSYLQKPLDPSILANEVARLLARPARQ